MGPAKFEVGDVMRIATFDIRLCNLDRHAGNILVSRSAPYQCRSSFYEAAVPDLHSTRISASAPASTGLLLGDSEVGLVLSSTVTTTSAYRLVPIDHGFCLPHVLQLSDVTFAWLAWPQVKLPVPDDVKEYVSRLNADADCDRIRYLVGAAIPETHLLTLKVCTKLLQSCLSQGLSLYEVAMFMIVPKGSTISRLQALVNRAVSAVVARDRCKSQVHSLSPLRLSPLTVHVEKKDGVSISDETLHHAMALQNGGCLWEELSASIDSAVNVLVDQAHS